MLSETVPDVVCTVTVYVPVPVPGPDGEVVPFELLPLPQAVRSGNRKSSATGTSNNLRVLRCPPDRKPVRSRKPAGRAQSAAKDLSTEAVLAEVEMVRFTFCAVVPDTATLGGLKEHDAVAGRPVQAMLTVPAKPFWGVMLRASVPLWPELTVRVPLPLVAKR